jgi:hypothetical protein
MVTQWPIELAVWLVSIPAWVRPNIYVSAPDERAYSPVAEHMLLTRYHARGV